MGALSNFNSFPFRSTSLKLNSAWTTDSKYLFFNLVLILIQKFQSIKIFIRYFTFASLPGHAMPLSNLSQKNVLLRGRSGVEIKIHHLSGHTPIINKYLQSKEVQKPTQMHFECNKIIYKIIQFQKS